MRIIKTKDYDEMSRKAANLIAAQILLKNNSVLGLATGSTMTGLYHELIRWYERGDLDFSAVSSVNLDEYVGLPGDHHQSYRYYMNENLFHHINIRQDCAYLPDGMATDAEQECAAYEAQIEALGGTDLQLLGLGHNGHIGFNEPADIFPKVTHEVALEESTIKANARFFTTEDEVPKTAITMGIGSIMRSKQILLCVSGESKADTLKQVLTGPITPQCPGSIVQLHPNLVVVADEGALSLY